jgi:hypothetical protein
MSDDSLRESKRKQHIERVRQWQREHPGYQQAYRRRQREFADAYGLARNGTIPVKANKVTYTVDVRRSLKPHERHSATKPQRPHRSSSNDEDLIDFIPTDTW